MNLFNVLVNMELQKLASYDQELETKKLNASDAESEKVWAGSTGEINQLPRKFKDYNLGKQHDDASSARREARAGVDYENQQKVEKSRAESKQRSSKNSAGLQMQWDEQEASKPLVEKITESALNRYGKDALKSSEPYWSR